MWLHSWRQTWACPGTSQHNFGNAIFTLGWVKAIAAPLANCARTRTHAQNHAELLRLQAETSGYWWGAPCAHRGRRDHSSSLGLDRDRRAHERLFCAEWARFHGFILPGLVPPPLQLISLEDLSYWNEEVVDTGAAAYCFKVVGKRSGKQVLRAVTVPIWASVDLSFSVRICMSRPVTLV